MTTFLEKKLDALEAIVKARKRARLAAVVALAVFSTAAVTGDARLVAVGVAALVAAAGLTWQARRRSLAVSAVESGEDLIEAEPEASATQPDLHPLAGPAGPPREEPVGCSLTVPESVTLRTGSGEVVVAAAVAHAATFLLSHPPERPPEDDGVDYPLCDFRLRDGDGAWWGSTTFLDRNALTRPLEAADREIRFWEDAPAAWRTALERDCLIAGLRQLMDSRDRIELPVGDRAVTMMFKYQGPVLDLGWLVQEEKVMVRAAGMYYEVWADEESRDIVDQVTFAYLMDPLELLPLVATETHWEEWGAWEDDMGEERPGPLFRGVDA